MTESTLFHLLTEEYTLCLAQNDDDFKHVKEIRREVFSKKYNLSPDILESKGYFFDQDDAQSFMYLIKHNPSNTYVGTIRVYFINLKTPLQELPMQKDGHIEGIYFDISLSPVCEVSRLALTDKLPLNEALSQLRLSSYLSMLLMVGTRISTFLYHFGMMYSIMEPALDRILKRQGVKFEQIGEPVDYYGMRTPYANNTKEMMLATEKSMGKLTRHYLKQLCKEKDAFWQFVDNNPYLEREDIHLDKICKLFEAYGDDVPLALLMGEI